MQTFSQLGLIEPILRALDVEGYKTPTAVQSSTIPTILQGKDLLGCAQTGTGKTAAFLLPILQLLHQNTPAKNSGPRALVVCPTRELAAQIAESASAYGRFLKIRHTTVFGGVSYGRQIQDIRRGIDLLIATPGRLLDHVKSGVLKLDAIQMLVLDEADRMLDMGFIPDIQRILRLVPQQRQTLMYSATMPQDIRRLAEQLLRSPEITHATPAQSAAPQIRQSVYFVSRRNKPTMLKHVLNLDGVDRVLVFTRTKHGADKVVNDLQKSGFHAAAIHGNKSQAARTKALARFRSTNPPVLVATDIASRGIDVDQVTHVINFDVPDAAETYVHRIGRTARAGSDGNAISLIDRKEERSAWRSIERLVGTTISVESTEGVVLDPVGDRAVVPAIHPEEDVAVETVPKKHIPRNPGWTSSKRKNKRNTQRKPQDSSAGHRRESNQNPGRPARGQWRKKPKSESGRHRRTDHATLA